MKRYMTLLAVCMLVGISFASPVKSNLAGSNTSFVLEEKISTPYITKGLVALWDGKTLVEGEPWTDIVANRKLGNPLGWSKNGCLVTGNASVVTVPVELGNEYTIEVCKATEGANWNQRPIFMAYGGNAQSTGLAYSYYNYWYTFNGDTRVNVGYAAQSWRGPRSFSASVQGAAAFFFQHADQIYKTGQRILTNPLSVDEVRFFGTSGATYYCIRIYDRVLTESEITANCLVDKERFGL